jgi:signal transduction histidine kinase
VGGFDKLLRELNIRYVAVVNSENDLERYVTPPQEGVQGMFLRFGEIVALRELARVAPDGIAISDLLRVNNEPLFFIAREFPDGVLILGALELDFIREVQRAIVFGDRGHSMIVDAKGRVIAHPNREWEQLSQDASKLSVVGAMMRGETGVSQFYSPPMEAEMIAGHTSVPGVNWGVMVPQPFEELEARANDVRVIALVLAFVGIFVAAVFGWLLARYIARPVVAVAEAASEVAAGGLHTRVEESIYGPMELRVLAKSFNHMVTGLEQREAGLLAAKDVAESANRSKSEFLANISHELRTPLNAVIGFSDLMRNEIHGPLGSEKYNDYLNDIHGSGSHLLDIINDVLDMSKAEAGRMDIEEEEFDLGAALQACTRMVSERAAVGGIQVECLTTDDLPNLFADGRLVRQIVLNLLTNAIKFTGDGGEVVLEALVDDAGDCRISVADTGIGIAPEFLDSIMQPFVQVDSGMDRKYQGTGLGLSLVKSMAELHDAKVDIESTPGVGTTIFVRFPAERVRA